MIIATLIILLVAFNIAAFLWGFEAWMVWNQPSGSCASYGLHDTKATNFELMLNSLDSAFPRKAESLNKKDLQQ